MASKDDNVLGLAQLLQRDIEAYEAAIKDALAALTAGPEPPIITLVGNTAHRTSGEEHMDSKTLKQATVIMKSIERNMQALKTLEEADELVVTSPKRIQGHKIDHEVARLLIFHTNFKPLKEHIKTYLERCLADSMEEFKNL